MGLECIPFTRLGASLVPFVDLEIVAGYASHAAIYLAWDLNVWLQTMTWGVCHAI